MDRALRPAGRTAVGPRPVAGPRSPALRAPVATYRLQLREGVRLEDARRLVPYLDALGVTDAYASPLLAARPGSPHGYDVVDPGRLDPELGSEAELEAWAAELRARGMGLLLDIVPNHVAADPANPWWADVLEHGRASAFAGHFDIDWSPWHGLWGDRVLLPILGEPYAAALASGAIRLAVDEAGLHVRYHEHRCPLEPASYAAVLEGALEGLPAAATTEARELRRLRDAFSDLPPHSSDEPSIASQRRERARGLTADFLRWLAGSAAARRALEKALRNAEPPDALHPLLEAQPYRLAHWRMARVKRNYRRFFDINQLVGIRVERAQVFEDAHRRIGEWIARGIVTGLRVDHVDGLYDPEEYLERLQTLAPRGGEDLYVVVEKILGEGESLPKSWATAGTTGYEFLNIVTGLFVDPTGVRALGSAYAEWTGDDSSFEEVVYGQKERVLRDRFAGDLRELAARWARLAENDPRARDLDPRGIEAALAEVTAALPVYRTYVRSREVARRDTRILRAAVKAARRRRPELSAAALDFVERALRLSVPESSGGGLRLVMRWQQWTGAVMAKGLEDTALYRYNRLLALNEVGGAPDRPGVTPEEAHAFLRARARRWPLALSATSTHDTKRGEDARARIGVLSEMPEAWVRHARRWRRWNERHRRAVRGKAAPDANEEWLIYQTLVGAWPSEGPDAAFRRRVKEYVVKAAREAKHHTSWRDRDPEYEAALEAFLDAILARFPRNRFLADFERFQEKVAFHGAIVSLAQTLVKIGAPGVPDLYQGSELWNLALVDPDNRRRVNFRRRITLLNALKEREGGDRAALLGDLLAGWRDGRVKMYTTYKALAFRRERAGLFLEGAYVPLGFERLGRRSAFAFARRRGREWAVIAVPRWPSRLSPPGTFPLGRTAWGTGALRLPGRAPAAWVNVLTGERLEVTRLRRGPALRLTRVFANFPVALLAPAPAGAA